jgi:glycerophosphoryl diester phosphodiesterase
VVLVLGHRGAPLAAPENTIAAFVAARRLGADGVELDVRRTADGALVVHHDATVAGGRRIATLDAGDLPEEIPMLEAALDACAGMVVNIEIKNSPAEVDHDPDEGAAVGVAGLLARRGSGDAAIVSAFSLASIDAVKRVSPAVRTGLLTVAAIDQAWALDLAHEHGHDALHVQHPAVTAELVDRAHALAVSVLAWTVDGADEMQRLAAAGVDTIVTNEVERAVAAVGGRGRRPY